MPFYQPAYPSAYQPAYQPYTSATPIGQGPAYPTSYEPSGYQPAYSSPHAYASPMGHYYQPPRIIGYATAAAAAPGNCPHYRDNTHMMEQQAGVSPRFVIPPGLANVAQSVPNYVRGLVDKYVPSPNYPTYQGLDGQYDQPSRPIYPPATSIGSNPIYPRLP